MPGSLCTGLRTRPFRPPIPTRRAPRSWVRPSGYQCDEYPYKSTLEGGATGNSYAEMILASPNTTQGAYLGTFYNQNRVLDGDAFWVSISN